MRNKSFSKKKRNEIKEFIKKELNEDQEPLFYALSGSHLYGFPSEEGGDLDVRGFHVVKSEQYIKLNSPKEQIEVEKNWNSSFKQDKIDLVSYELKKFGYLVYKTNFNVLEWIFGQNIIWNRKPKEIDELRKLMRSHLPADVPYHYRGMARQNYNKYLLENSGSYKPTAKKHLYVLRGLLGAIYIQKNQSIEPNILRMAEELLRNQDLEIVKELIDTKLESGESAEISKDLEDRAKNLIEKLFSQVEAEPDKDDEKLTRQIDNWMMKVRGFER